VDFRKLRYFVGVAEAGGFRRAARKLNIAQPALSKQIRELEDEIGLKLLERGQQGVCLTSDGARFLAESRDIIERIDKLTNMAAADGRQRAAVKIGAPSAIAAYLFGPLAHRLHDLHPEIHLRCISDMPRLMDSLISGELDLGLVTLVDPDEIGPGWIVSRLVREQDYLVGPKGSIVASRPIAFATVIGLPLVLTPMPHSRRRHMQNMAAQAGATLNVAAEAGAIGAQASFVCQGLGYAVMPYSAANLMKSSGPLEIAPIEGLRSWRLLVRRGGQPQSPASMIVSDMIVGLFRDGLPSLDGVQPSPIRFRSVG